MQNKIKLYIYISIGLGLPFLIRTTINSYPLRNIESPYLTNYIHSLDMALIFLWIAIVWKSKALPFSGKQNVDKLWVILFLGLFTQSFFTQYPVLSWIWSGRMYLGVAFLWYILRFKNFAQELLWITQGLILGMVGQSLIVVTQFILQRSTGIPLIVEPVIARDLAGVAKVELLNGVFIRGYGTFPHPNILAFVTIMSLLVLYTKYLGKRYSLYLFVLILSSSAIIDHYIVTSIQSYLMVLITGGYLFSGKYFNLHKQIRNITLIILHIVLILTFSKWGLITLVVLDLFCLTLVRNYPLFHVEQFQKNTKSVSRAIINGIAFAVGIILLLLPYPQIWSTFAKRMIYLQDATTLIQSNFWIGVGTGQYVANLSGNRELWQYEPVHNVFLLLFSEIGLVGLSLTVVILVIECYTYIYGHKKQR